MGSSNEVRQERNGEVYVSEGDGWREKWRAVM